MGREDAIAAGRRFWKDHSRATAGGGVAAGESWTGPDAADVRGGFGAGGFLAAAGEAPAAVPAGTDAGGAERGAGSGFIMLTGGVEAAVGNSALVGLPVSSVGPNGVACPGTNVVPGAGPRPAATAGPTVVAAVDVGVFHAAT
jgi:hypothetical protein